VLLLALLAVAVWMALRLPGFGGTAEGQRLERMQRSPAFVQGRFENTPPYIADLAVVENFRLYTQGQLREPQFTIPVLPLAPERLRSAPQPGLRTIWFGHASVLVEIDGVRIMTDPILSERASPVQIVGPKRFHPPPLPLEQLSGIDAVVISHDHYDHLDMATVRQLAQGGTHFYVGLGIGAHLERWGVPRALVHEMAWWDHADVKGVRIHCAPARHYSGRRSMNNSTLWASWMLRGPSRSLYFSGDTGHASHFGDIRQRLGAPDVALMKVGAYGSTWLDIHMDPEAAVRAHRELGARTMLPVHWATFNLAYHAWEEPIVRTLAAAARMGVDVITPRPGEVFEFGQPFRSQAWYQPGR
jgi:L-ascorbate metabolism protein UlaG (beta-lactamase superfamily)